MASAAAAVYWSSKSRSMSKGKSNSNINGNGNSNGDAHGHDNSFLGAKTRLEFETVLPYDTERTAKANRQTELLSYLMDGVTYMFIFFIYQCITVYH